MPTTSTNKRRKVALLAAAGVLGFSGLLASGAEEAEADIVDQELGVDHSECSLFGPQREELLNAERRQRYAMSALTVEVTSQLPKSSVGSPNYVVPGGSRTNSFQQLDQLGTIDGHLYRAMQEAGVTPAQKTNDFEFIRRASLDLTGRVPTPERVQQFVADAAPDKRAKLVEELLAKPEWVDKWTMFLGDLFRNTSRNTQVNRYPEGRNAFYTWIKNSLTANKRYNQIATEMITATGGNSYQQGELNFMVGSFVTGSPRSGQDIFDQQAADIGKIFLGVSHMNCILCHDGRRHLDTLSVWGKNATRYETWQMASFLSRTAMTRVPVDPTKNNPYYWRVEDSGRVDYPLNTTTGNRPARQPIGNLRNVAPVYPFSGRGPNSGENYRVALARELTADVQFARAAVNYVWKQFFGLGFVEPVNQFDLARLDGDNPPEGWTVQPSNPWLLNELATDFMNSGYDLKALMRQIVNSEAYQLSSRYDGTWNPSWERLFARKLVRRLWGEEIHDAVAQTSNILPRYTIAGLGQINFAMQVPEPTRMPGGDIASFLDSFMRGNRDDAERRSDGSVPQAMNLMNDTFVMTRTRASGTGATASLLRTLLAQSNEQLVSNMFLTVLSRYPTDAEKNVALASLNATAGATARQQKAEDLLWSLYNKVDFIFNY